MKASEIFAAVNLLVVECHFTHKLASVGTIMWPQSLKKPCFSVARFRN